MNHVLQIFFIPPSLMAKSLAVPALALAVPTDCWRTQGVEEGVIGGLEARFLQLGLWGMIFQLFQPIGLKTTTFFCEKTNSKP